MKFHLSTRKGLFTFTGQGTSWQISDTAFLGDPVSFTFHDKRDDTLYAALNLGHFGVKLRRRDAGSEEWQEIAVPEYPKADDGKGDSLVQIWSMAGGGLDRPNRLWAGTIPGGLFLSEDRGQSWQLVESLWQRPEREKWFGGGYDQAGIHSILVDPDNSDRLVIGISCGGVWITNDACKTWEPQGQGMRSAYMPPEQAHDPVTQDPHLIVQCAADPNRMYIQHHNGIFRSDDRGANWTEIEDVEPSVFGFTVAVHPKQPDTAWFVPAIWDEFRFPVDAKLVVNRTDDAGKSFTHQREGLPQEHSYDLVYRHALDVCTQGDHLVFGTTTGNLWVSDNGGNAWHLLSHTMPAVYAVVFEK
jgi:photosystem II stability/assembly factor-like uncharacterized protein